GGDAAVKLNVLAGGTDPSAARDAEIERQLNIAFDAEGRIDPFRFFAIDAGTSFHLGVAYDHFVAAGDAIVRLLKNIIDGTGEAVAAATRLNPYAPSYAHLFWREKGALLAGLANLPGLAAECRRAARPRYQSPEDGYNAFTSFRIEPPERATL